MDGVDEVCLISWPVGLAHFDQRTGILGSLRGSGGVFRFSGQTEDPTIKGDLFTTGTGPSRALGVPAEASVRTEVPFLSVPSDTLGHDERRSRQLPS